MGFGAAYPVDAPPPEAARHGLLDTARIVPEPNDYWLNGVVIWPYPRDLPGSFDQCATGSQVTAKSAGAIIADPAAGNTFGAFTLYEPETCTSRIIAEVDDEFRRRVMTTLAATEGYGVEFEFETGFRVPANPALSDPAAQLAAPAATAQTRLAGLAYLERAIANTGRAGMIHAPVEIVTGWLAQGHVFEDDDAKLYTKAKHTPVVAGTGYRGIAPSDQAANTGTQLAAYATGPVDIRRSEMFVNPPTLAEALNRSDNSVVYRAERYYAYDWDATLLRAWVRIDWTT